MGKLLPYALSGLLNPRLVKRGCYGEFEKMPVERPSALPMIDYVRVTFPDTMSPEEVQDQFEWDDAWVERPFGIKGYRHSRVAHGITIAWEGSRGVHVNIPGKACRWLDGNSAWDWRYQFERWARMGANFTRLDVCFDDREGRLDLDVISKQVANGFCASRARGWQPIGSGKIGEGTDALARTVSVGSASSDTFLLFYDKAKEQGVPGPWIRCEIRWFRDRADAAVGKFVMGGAAKFAELLAGHIAFHEEGHQVRKVDRPICAWWQLFLGFCARDLLRVEKVKGDIEDVMRWIRRQVGPFLGVAKAYLECRGSSLDALAREQESRWTWRHEYLAFEAREDPQEKINRGIDGWLNYAV